MPSLAKAKLNFKIYRNEAVFKVERILSQVISQFFASCDIA
jgi:hypothetical protein